MKPDICIHGNTPGECSPCENDPEVILRRQFPCPPALVAEIEGKTPCPVCSYIDCEVHVSK